MKLSSHSDIFRYGNMMNRPNNFLRNSIEKPWNLVINLPSFVHIHPLRSAKSWQFRHGWRGRLLEAQRRVLRTWLGHLEMSRGDGQFGSGVLGKMGGWATWEGEGPPCFFFFFPGEDVFCFSFLELRLSKCIVCNYWWYDHLANAMWCTFKMLQLLQVWNDMLKTN